MCPIESESGTIDYARQVDHPLFRRAERYVPVKRALPAAHLTGIAEKRYP